MMIRALATAVAAWTVLAASSAFAGPFAIATSILSVDFRGDDAALAALDFTASERRVTKAGGTGRTETTVAFDVLPGQHGGRVTVQAFATVDQPGRSAALAAFGLFDARLGNRSDRPIALDMQVLFSSSVVDVAVIDTGAAETAAFEAGQSGFFTADRHGCALGPQGFRGDAGERLSGGPQTACFVTTADFSESDLSFDLAPFQSIAVGTPYFAYAFAEATMAAPEPASLAVFGTALTVLGAGRRRR